MNIKDDVLNRETYKINISYEVPKNYHLKPNCKYIIYYEDTDEDYIPESGDALSDLIQDAIKELDENGDEYFDGATIVEVNLRTEEETVLAELRWEERDSINESSNPLKDFQNCHKKKQKGLSPFSYLNPNAGDVEYNIDFFNRAMGSGDASSTGSGEGMGEDLDTAHDSNFKVIKYNKYLYAILDKAKNILVRKPEYINDPEAYKYAYDSKGKAYFFTTKDKDEAEAYANDLQIDYDTALNESLDQCKITYRYVLDDTLDDDEAIDYIKSDLEKYNLNLDLFKIDTKFTADKNIDTIVCGQRKNIEKWLEDRIYQDYNLDKSSRIYKNYINNITEALKGDIMDKKKYKESMKEELRIWGDEEISAQNDLVRWEQALEDFLENNNIEYDQVKCDVFDYGTNVVIINPKDIEEVAQEIEDHYGFKTTIEDNNIYVDVTEEYEDEYGDIKTRVAKRYDESLDSEVTLQELADEIDYNGADYKGAEIPKAIDYMINQINIPDNMRLKWFDVDVVSDDVIQLTYVTQEPFSPTDSDSFIKEVTNMINILANKYRYDKPFTLALDVTARDGRDEGQLVYDINVNAGADMSLKEDISSKKYTLESKLYDYFKATNPNDPFGDGIDKEATFRDLFNAINDNANVYKVIFGNENSGDSAVREELFNGLANILNTSYSDVYNAWLGYHPLLESNNIIDIRKELNRLDSEEYRDLLNMYDSIELAEHEKKHIAELISQNKIDELVDYLQELYYVYINVYDGNGNGIVTNDLGTFYKKDDLLDDGKFYKHEGLNDKTLKEDIDWDYFDQFETIVNKYMPDRGEGETMASQIVTAVNKLIYKWYNDGDVYDNTHGLQGWANDLSDYANWLYKYVPKTQYTLDLIEEVSTDGGYEEILQLLADLTLNEKFLSKYTDEKCLGSIYNCNGPFKFIDSYDNDEDDF